MNVGMLTQGSSFLATLGWMISSRWDEKPVAMKNTHHAEMDELLIGRNLDWVEDGGVFREEPVPYKVDSPVKNKKLNKRK